MATLSGLRSERRLLRAQLKENDELYDKINALYKQLRLTKQHHNVDYIFQTKSVHKRELYWKGFSHNAYENLYNQFQTMEKKDIDKLNQAIDATKKKMDLIKEENSSLLDEIDILTSRINNWDD